MNNLLSLMGLLRVCYHLHQTAHWQSQGPQSYSDHLLFERLYTGLTPSIDALAEKIVCEFGADSVDPCRGVLFFGEWMDSVCRESQGYVERSLSAEMKLLVALSDCIEKEQISYGMEDLLNALLSERETAVYLLKQRLR